jgi:60 kDa SS-A/Ro ribonucleoprotein
MDPLTLVSTRATPQTEQTAPEQVRNSAGGYVFAVDDMTRLRRFCTIGVESGTYYASERALTLDNAQTVLRLARERTSDVVAEVVAISDAGRAPKQQPGLFALAACAKLGDAEGRRAALDALPKVARTGTALYLFAGYLEQFGGWGRGTKRAVARWYAERDLDGLAYQAVKYRQREGWSHRDLLRLSHPETVEVGRKALYEWIVRGTVGDDTPPLVRGFLEAQRATKVVDWTRLIAEHPLSWDMLPDAAVVEPKVWTALLEHDRVPATALLRQLPRLTNLGLLSPLGPTVRAVVDRLTDPGRLKRGRIHPISVLMALRTYQSGTSARGDRSRASATWRPSRPVLDALDAAFYAAFEAVEPAGKRTLIALDVSGSMGSSAAGATGLTARDVSAALSLVTAATEPATATVGFTGGGGGFWPIRNTNPRDVSGLTPLGISPRQRLDDVIESVSHLPFGATDCSLPMRWAEAHGEQVETFLVLTDNETWAGPVHAHQALQSYRRASGIPARLVVAAMTPTEFTIADPSDSGMLDVSGFDSAMPQFVADFSAGRV